MRLTDRILDPAPGSTRTKKRFAYLPVKAGGCLVWLESYEVMFAFIVTNFLVNVGAEQVAIKHGKWKLISTRLLRK